MFKKKIAKHEQTLLDMAEGLGLSPAYSCRSGICHTCAVPIREGEVEYVEDPLGSPEPGFVLICCCRPKSRAMPNA